MIKWQALCLQYLEKACFADDVINAFGISTIIVLACSPTITPHMFVIKQAKQLFYTKNTMCALVYANS